MSSILTTITSKLPLYASELIFSVRAPRRFADKIKLALSTLNFHRRNWLGRPVDRRKRLNLTIDIDGYETFITLRPHDGDLAIFHEIFVRGAYDIPLGILVPSRVKTVVDLGANVGFSALYFAAKYRGARIFSIEPNPDNMEILRSNVSGEGRVIPIQACVTCEADQEVFISTTGRGSHFQMNTIGDGVRVPGVSINQLCESHGINHIDLLKVDIEGAEVALFAEGSFLQRVGVIVAELHGEYTLDMFNADLSKWGFLARINDRSREQGIVVATRI